MANITVLIVEDDPMVANINVKFTEAVPGFAVIGIARNGQEALQMVADKKPELVILDIYMPEVAGMEVLSLLRRQEISLDFILITAANDTDTISKAMRQGVVDYIIKPFKFERYRTTLEMYRNFRHNIDKKDSVNQMELDSILPAKASNPGGPKELPKNFHAQTLQVIMNSLLANPGPRSAEEVASDVGISRVTARRYLEYLVTEGRLQMVLGYLSVGRPVHRFSLK